MKIKNIAIPIIATLGLTSCLSTSHISTPSEYVDAGKAITVEKMHTNFLGLTPMNKDKTVTILLEEIKGKCPSGVTNIRTTQSMMSIGIGFYEKLKISANCKQ